MKKTFKKLFASVLALAMMLTTFSLTSISASADEGYLMYLGYGGHNDWSLCYHGPDATDDNDAIVATTAMVKAGDTVTIGLELPSASDKTWWMAPVLVAEGVTNVDYTINSILVDGVDVLANVDLAAGKAWWYEGTGPYTAEQAVRLAGGYNEWGDKYMAEGPANFSKIEYNITVKAIDFGAPAAGTAAPSDAEYDMYLGYGGANDWSLQYNSPNNADNNAEIVVTDAKAKVGDTVTIGLEFPVATDKTWWMAPVLVAEGVTNVDYTINSILVDGVDILANVDLTAGKAWWYEGTGEYTAEQAVRLAGGYNEWGDKYMAEGPANCTKIEYNITLNAVEVGGSAAGEATLSDAEYPAFIAYGGNNDWGIQYYGEGSGSNSGEVTATNGILKNGETTVLSLEFPVQPDCTWFVSPCMVVDNVAAIADSTTFDVKVFVDGTEVAVDMAAGKMFWGEGTGDYTETQCLRIGGGYNEWGDKYMAAGPANFSKIEFHITPTIYTQEVVVVEDTQPAFDPNGTYHAYLGVQTPTWIFRNSWDDATYGKDSGCFDQMGIVDNTTQEWVGLGGTFTDVEITGNGTYTVAVNGYDFSGTYADAPILTDGLFNLLFLSTDLPMNDAVVISDVTLKMDGKEISKQAEPFMDKDSKEYKKVLFANIWNNEIPELPFYAAPTSSIEITFTVAGFANDAVVETPVEETPVETPETTPADTTPADDTADVVAPAEETDGPNMVVIIVVVVAVVAVAAVAGVIVAKKKKN